MLDQKIASIALAYVILKTTHLELNSLGKKQTSHEAGRKATDQADNLIPREVVMWIRYGVSTGALEILCQRFLFSGRVTVLAALICH